MNLIKPSQVVLIATLIIGCDPPQYSVDYSFRPSLPFVPLDSEIVQAFDSLAVAYSLSDTSRSGQYVVKTYEMPSGFLKFSPLYLRIEYYSNRYWVKLGGFNKAGAYKAQDLDADVINILERLVGRNAFIIYDKYTFAIDPWRRER